MSIQPCKQTVHHEKPCWGMQTVAKGIPVSFETLPLRVIIINAYHRSSHDLLSSIHFVAHLFFAGSHSSVFQYSHPWVRDILSLLVLLYAFPHVGLCCNLEVEIHFSHLLLLLSDFIESTKDADWSSGSCTSTLPCYSSSPTSSLSTFNQELKSPALKGKETSLSKLRSVARSPGGGVTRQETIGETRNGTGY